MSLKLAVLASGSGTNFQAMVDAVRRGALDADIRLVICNRPGAKVIERAKAAGIICAVMDHKLWPSREAYDLAVADAILKSGADTVALAGYMRMLTAGFLNAFPHRVVNVHPALLPSFPGIHGAADAQAWGVKITGCTVHLVDEIMDHGEVIIQAAVPAIAGEPLDDLQSRIHAQEHRIYPQALQWLAEDRIKMNDDGRSPLPLPACSSARRLRKAFRGRKILMVLRGRGGLSSERPPLPLSCPSGLLLPLPRLSHAGSKPTPDERGPGRPKPSRRMGG